LQVQQTRHTMLRKVSTETMKLYWQIGKTVSEKTKQEKRGSSAIEKLAKDLQREFAGVRGFSASNIWRMRTLYEVYSQNEILVPLVREIGWVQNYRIIEQCKDDLEREFYLRQTSIK